MRVGGREEVVLQAQNNIEGEIENKNRLWDRLSTFDMTKTLWRRNKPKEVQSAKGHSFLQRKLNFILQAMENH